MTDITNDLVPRYAKTDFDDVATEFLAQYYPKALENPMPVPIRDVVMKKMGLRIREWHLTEDLSVYGQMCFTSGLVEIYLPETEEYREIKVRWGTMIIDPDTLNQRNIGCQNNTIAMRVSIGGNTATITSSNLCLIDAQPRYTNAPPPNLMNPSKASGRTKCGWSGKQKHCAAHPNARADLRHYGGTV
jgi:hypothetical protein